MRAGEGVGLEPGHVHHGLVGVQRRPAVQPPPLPTPGPAGPALRVRDVVVLLPGPALVAPPLAALVAAALGEGQPGGVGDRRAADPEGGQLDARGAGARCRRRSRGGRRRACTGPAGTSTGSRPGVAARRGRARRGRRARERGAAGRARSPAASSRRAAARGAAPARPARRRRGRARRARHATRSRTDSQVAERLRAVEQRQVAADVARRLERVVHRGVVGRQQRLAAVAVHQPQVLVGGDVREVPHQRAHQRRVRGLDVGVGEALDERQRALARLGEELGVARGGDAHRRNRTESA